MAAKQQLTFLLTASPDGLQATENLLKLDRPSYETIMDEDAESMQRCTDEAVDQEQALAPKSSSWFRALLGGSKVRVASEPAGPPKRLRSLHPECQATLGPRDDPGFLDRVRPCGNLSSVCTDIPVVYANRDYPGGGVGAVMPGQDYLVQFDVGLHPEVAREILRRRLREIDSCVHCPGLEAFGEQCYEAVVTGGAMWGDLGKSSLGLAPQAYDCMGGCGIGCQGALAAHSKEDVGALDCLKHDLCSAWKTVHSGRATQGFCHDPDCGDEAAMAIFNCWRGYRFFGSLGGARSGPFSEPAVCDASDSEVKGCWSHSGWFTPGRCKVFQGWERGQGIPQPLTSPIQML